ncbi:hypothetical protein EU528_01445 [Candidatus Thorarchaeota archaeon]|nr:MAG: hypothetical protein EU528_01445 [Candidatus Thorarchaeota archaeon]
MRSRLYAMSMLAIVVIILSSYSSVHIANAWSDSDPIQRGPYVDEIIFKVIANQDQRILALQSGEIEMDNSFFDPVHFATLAADPEISIHHGIRNGYGHLTINCAKYPLNISGLRRAFAFAFDKTRVTEEIMDGFSIEHDSLVPLPNGWCAEDQFDWHYYTAQPEIGNQILDDLNFTIDEGTGFRLAPDGTPFNITIEYAACSCELAGALPQVGVDALHSLHINARTRAADFNEYISRLDSHGDYDMVWYAVNFYDNDVDWLAHEYWSEYVDVEYENPTNFANETYDSWRDALLYGTTYEEVYEAASEMQKILQYNVPRLVVFENTYMQGYRNDQFTGHVEDLGRYISGPWTLRKIHKLDGTFGGTVTIAIAEEPDSFNIYDTDSSYSEALLANLWPSLYQYGPDLTPVSDLAKNVLTETHSDNPAVPDGHTRFTFDIIQNATWSDGTPLTAEDVAFSLTYAYESERYGNPAGADMWDLAAAYAPTPYTAIIEFNTESYWHFSNFAFDYIIPEHIFNDENGIGYEGWFDWNPVYDPEQPNVNCGPYIFSDYEAGEFYKLERNPLFHYIASSSVATIVTTTTATTATTTTTTTATNQTPLEMNWSQVFSVSIGSVSGIVMLYCVVSIIQTRRNQ